MLLRIDAEELDVETGLGGFPDLTFVLQYWSGKAAGRWAPFRADIDPIEIPEILPRIMLCDVNYDPETGAVDSFRYRLSGTAIYEAHGFEATNLRPTDLKPPEYAELVNSHYTEAVARREPMAHVIVFEALNKSRSYARIILPLTQDGSRVDILMTIDSEKQNSLPEFLEDIKKARAARTGRR